jgi:hypothetical protein
MDPVTLQLILALAPVAEQLVMDGTKYIVNLRTNMSTEDMIKALEASKSGFPAMEQKA